VFLPALNALIVQRKSLFSKENSKPAPLPERVLAADQMAHGHKKKPRFQTGLLKAKEESINALFLDCDVSGFL